MSDLISKNLVAAREIGRVEAVNEVISILLRRARAGNDYEKIALADVAKEVAALAAPTQETER